MWLQVVVKVFQFLRVLDPLASRPIRPVVERP